MASYIIYLKSGEYPLRSKRLYQLLEDIECSLVRRGMEEETWRPYCIVKTNGENGKINEQGLSKYPVDEVIPWNGELPPLPP